MMERQQQQVILRRQAQQRHAQQRAGGKVERAQCIVMNDRLYLRRAGFRRFPREVDYRQGERPFRENDQLRLAIDRREARAQHVMALHHGLQAAFERGQVEVTAQAHGEADGIAGIAGPKLVVQPECRLGEGDRRRRGGGEAGDGLRAGVSLPLA